MQVYFLTAFSVEPSSVIIENVLQDDKLQGTEGLDLIITCTAIGGQPRPDLKLIISGSTVATGKQSLQHTLSTISRSYDRKTLTCYAGNEDISHYSLANSAKVYLTRKLFFFFFFTNDIHIFYCTLLIHNYMCTKNTS